MLLFSRQRRRLVRGIDWETLVFFVALFVLMASAWQSAALQRLAAAAGEDLANPPLVLGLGVLVSQLISNVPQVALHLPLLDQAQGGSEALLALAAGSTLVGNLLILAHLCHLLPPFLA